MLRSTGWAPARASRGLRTSPNLAPHPPWSVSEPYNLLYDPESVPLPVRRESLEAEGSQHPVTQMLHEVLPRKEFFPNGDGPAAFADERDVLQARATYYGMMTEVDHNLGRLFDYLRESGQDERTLIVFTADHGEQLGDHYLFDKRGYFDGGFHIPLIVRDPQAHGTRGHQIEAFTETIDTTPTILDWLGLEVPDQCDGVPLTPFLRGKTPERWRTEIHWEYDFREISSYQSQIQERFGLYPDQCSLAVLRDHRYKYVHCTALPPLLFDLQDDPHEFQNLADDPGCQPQVREYAQKNALVDDEPPRPHPLQHQLRVRRNAALEGAALLIFRNYRRFLWFITRGRPVTKARGVDFSGGFLNNCYVFEF